jgi:hypothetical protein
VLHKLSLTHWLMTRCTSTFRVLTLFQSSAKKRQRQAASLFFLRCLLLLRRHFL